MLLHPRPRPENASFDRRGADSHSSSQLAMCPSFTLIQNEHLCNRRMQSAKRFLYEVASDILPFRVSPPVSNFQYKVALTVSDVKICLNRRPHGAFPADLH